MKRKKIGLLYGGRSGEHEVSLRSAASVVNNLDLRIFEPILIGIDKVGIWHLQQRSSFRCVPGQGEVLEIIKKSRPLALVPGKGLYQGEELVEIDVIFPVLHGTFGEDGTIQGLLEVVDIPYVGAGVLASSTAMDKEKAKIIWQKEGLPVVDFLVVRDASASAIAAIEQTFNYPLFIKPAVGGSSVGIHKVNSHGELKPALTDALNYSNKLLAEPAIEGRELECSLLGNRRPRAFPPGEILPQHGFYDYNSKYIDPEGALLAVPADLPAETAKLIEETAVRAYLALEISGMARVDFFLEKKSNRLYISELNTLPGFTSISMYPKLCENGGLPYPALLEQLIELALESHAEKTKLTYSLR